ncbi:MAG: type II toxin-antitoxin system VapC family toxin [Luteolibacter sp.]
MESLIVKACLDTHAVLWSLTDDPRLGAQARELIASAARTELIISDIVLLEASMLVAKGRLQMTCGPEQLLSKIADSFRVIPIDPRIAHLALSLDLPHGDPFDRVIAATAKVHGIPLLTRDRLIADSGVVEIVW